MTPMVTCTVLVTAQKRHMYTLSAVNMCVYITITDEIATSIVISCQDIVAETPQRVVTQSERQLIPSVVLLSTSPVI